jgi:hypothetical protein
VEKLFALWPVTPDLPGTVYHVMETGLGHYEADIPLDDYVAAARSLGDSGLAELVAEIQPRSQLIVPMRARGRVIGCLLLAMAESGRRFAADDLARFQELADRLGLMTDNAMLFAAAGEARRQAETAGGRLEVLQQATAGAARALTVGRYSKTPSTPGWPLSMPTSDGWPCHLSTGSSYSMRSGGVPRLRNAPPDSVSCRLGTRSLTWFEPGALSGTPMPACWRDGSPMGSTRSRRGSHRSRSSPSTWGRARSERWPPGSPGERLFHRRIAPIWLHWPR